jgi:hypothetical protein
VSWFDKCIHACLVWFADQSSKSHLSKLSQVMRAARRIMKGSCNQNFMINPRNFQIENFLFMCLRSHLQRRSNLQIPFRRSFAVTLRAYSSINMPESYTATEDAYNTIQPCKNFIVRLPSGNYKVIDLKPNTYHLPG